MRDAVRLVLPGPHELGAVAGGVASARSPRRLAARVVGALQRPGALGLDGVEAGNALERAERGRLAEAWLHALASAPPPTWTSSRSTAAPADGDLPGSVSPPSTARPFRLPWQVNGSAPRGERAHQRVDASDPRRARLARADGDCAPSSSRRSTTARIGVDRHEDVQPSPAGRGHDGGRERRVAAARDREVAARARAARPRRSATSSQSRTPNRWRALCEPETLPVSSLTQTPPAPEKPSAVAQLVASRERRDAEAVAVHRATRSSSGGRARRNSHRRRPRRGDVIGVEQRPVAHERIRSTSPAGNRSAAGRARAAARGRRRRPAGVRAAERVRVVRRRARAAAGADEPAAPSSQRSPARRCAR